MEDYEVYLQATFFSRVESQKSIWLRLFSALCTVHCTQGINTKDQPTDIVAS